MKKVILILMILCCIISQHVLAGGNCPCPDPDPTTSKPCPCIVDGQLQPDFVKNNLDLDYGEEYDSQIETMLTNNELSYKDLPESVQTRILPTMSATAFANNRKDIAYAENAQGTIPDPTDDSLNVIGTISPTADASKIDTDALKDLPVSAWSKDNIDFFKGGALELMLQVPNFKTAYDSIYGDKLDTNELPSGTQSNLQNQQLTYQDPDGAVSSFQLDTFDPTDKFKFMNDGSVNFNDYNLRGAKNLSFFVFALLFLAFVFLDGRRSPLVPYSAPRMGLPPLRLRLCPA